MMHKIYDLITSQRIVNISSHTFLNIACRFWSERDYSPFMIFQVYIKRKFTPELSATKLAPVFRRIVNFSAMGHHDSPEITLTLEKKNNKICHEDYELFAKQFAAYVALKFIFICPWCRFWFRFLATWNGFCCSLRDAAIPPGISRAWSFVYVS